MDVLRWLLDRIHPGLVHVELEGEVGTPSRWNTLRALRVLDGWDRRRGDDGARRRARRTLTRMPGQEEPFVSDTRPRARTAARRGRALTVLGAVVALGVAACTAGATPAPSASLPLEGTPWQLASYVGPEGGELPVPEAVAATARFEDGTVAGSGGCNAYSGTYTLDGSELTIGPVASTQMACAGPAGTLESVYLTALGNVASYTVDDVTLLLENADGAVILTFEERVATPLTGTTWVATRVNNGNQGVVSIIAGTEITATFTDDGKVAGSAGCNDYNGPYTVEGSTIAVGPLATTRKLCGAPEGIDDQEAQYLAALDAATVYTIDGTVLELRDASGALEVSYTAE